MSPWPAGPVPLTGAAGAPARQPTRYPALSRGNSTTHR